MLVALLTFIGTAAAFGLLVAFVVDGRIELAAAGAALVAIRLLATRIDMTFRGVTSLFEASLFLQDYDRFLARRTSAAPGPSGDRAVEPFRELRVENRSEEHTSELQSRQYLVCRL